MANREQDNDYLEQILKEAQLQDWKNAFEKQREKDTKQICDELRAILERSRLGGGR